ncbi:DUF2059 domain-containing protein [Consotaella aegiceratis]|uniref:DUF2059 domain-containing protein n=1 Tax=Consotaella aegiceratis TaxID=3097961 RepID=UPI002F42FD51
MPVRKTMRRVAFATVALALSSATPLYAQDASDAQIAAAKQAITAIHATDRFDVILMNAATQIKGNLISRHPDLQSQISDMVDEKALELAPRRADLENEVARVYAKLFSEEELRTIAEFYNSEAGKKLLEEGPIATREMMQAAEVWTNGIVRDLQKATTEGVESMASGNADQGAQSSQ